MKSTDSPLLLTIAALSLGFAGTSHGFTLMTAPGGIEISDTGAPGASVNDSFELTGGSFLSYVPEAGDPDISGDLFHYKFNMTGSVTGGSGGLVTYFGSYEIFYDPDGSERLDAGDFSFSSGTLDLTVDFGMGSNAGPYDITGVLHQTAGPAAGSPSSGFTTPDASFTGSYTLNLGPGQDYPADIGGTIRSSPRGVPDGGSSLVLLGIAALGTIAAKRKFGA